MLSRIARPLLSDSYPVDLFESYCSLLRVGLVLLMWTSFASALSLHQVQTTEQLLGAAVFFATSLLALTGTGGRWGTALFGLSLIAIRYFLGYAQARQDLLQHHATLVGTALIIAAAGPSFSRYSWGAKHPPLLSQADVVALFRLQIVVLYAMAAYHKLASYFLGGHELQYFFMIAYTGSLGWIQPENQDFFSALTLVVGLVELALAVGLSVPRTRSLAVGAGVIFHALVYLIMPAHAFSLCMLMFYPFFLDAGRFARLTSRISLGSQ